MTLQHDQATRMTARVAPYREAIQAARRAGFTWRDIGKILGVKDPNRLRWAVGHCERYEAEQIPLPTPEPESTPAVATATARTATAAPKAVDTAPTTGKVLFNSLPKIGGK